MQNKRLISIFIIVIIFALGIVLGLILFPQKQKIVEIEKVITQPSMTTQKEMFVVGIDSGGKGILAKMLIEVKPGNGLVLVNINNILADYETQLSSRMAAKTAANFTGITLDNFDIIYNIKANATIVEGPSGGATMAIGTVAALQNREINKSVLITGGIEEDGKITMVSGIKEKAQAAKENNFTLFIIPEVTDLESVYEETKSCTNLENFHYCEIKYNPAEKNISKILGIETVVVKNITEAINYMLI